MSQRTLINNEAHILYTVSMQRANEYNFETKLLTYDCPT